MEIFARTKMAKYIPLDSNRKDYYGMFSECPEEFEIVPGHIRLLDQVVEHIQIVMASQRSAVVERNRTIRKTKVPNSIRQSQDHGTCGS